MIPLTFALLAVLYAVPVLHFSWRYFLLRRAPSIPSAFYPLGWVLLAAREMKLITRFPTSLLIALALVVGAMGVLLILHHEMQQPFPFASDAVGRMRDRVLNRFRRPRGVD